MISVVIDEKNRKLLLKIKGHAGQAPKGQDLICASCSILAYTVAQVVKDAELGGKLKSAPRIKLKEGNTVVSCIPEDDTYEKMSYAFNIIATGYKLLAHNYPQYVEINAFGKA